uniref:Uncharacterized protein n=1 Tax=Rhipicephalus appendiculatus TaxID=34631 RepID=A0A131Y9W3_RHIAP
MTSTKQKNKKMQSLEGERKARISEAPPTVSTPCLVSSSNGKHTLRAVTNVHMYIYILFLTLSFLSSLILSILLSSLSSSDFERPVSLLRRCRVLGMRCDSRTLVAPTLPRHRA